MDSCRCNGSRIFCRMTTPSVVSLARERAHRKQTGIANSEQQPEANPTIRSKIVKSEDFASQIVDSFIIASLELRISTRVDLTSPKGDNQRQRAQMLRSSPIHSIRKISIRCCSAHSIFWAAKCCEWAVAMIEYTIKEMSPSRILYPG